MRILRHPVPRRRDRSFDAAGVFRSLFAGRPNAFWLDGGTDATTGRSFLGAGAEVVAGASVLPAVDARPRVAPADVPFPLGWVGWLSYGLARETTDVAVSIGPVDSASESAMMRVDRLISVDHATGAVELVALGEAWSGELESWRDEVLLALDAAAVSMTDDATRPVPPSTGSAAWADTDAEYLAKIAECQRAIRDGEAYQLCLTTEVAVAGRFDPFETYLALRSTSPSHRGGLLRIRGVCLLSASPEQFLTVAADGVVETKPMKGTRPRGVTVDEDRRLADELRTDPKERAENLMIVDLMRNDLGRVCAIGSVSVPSLFAVESYAQVHQLVSTVRGTLAPGRCAVEVIGCCFPAGSMTGTPKQRAMELLERLEGRPRGIYAGAFGWIGNDGTVSLAMVIRSIVVTGERATVGVGGGITSASVPERELAEVKLKARALLEVLAAA